MRWDRWSGWERGDPRWRVSVLDTSKLTVADVANEVVAWIEGERALLDRGG